MSWNRCFRLGSNDDHPLCEKHAWVNIWCFAVVGHRYVYTHGTDTYYVLYALCQVCFKLHSLFDGDVSSATFFRSSLEKFAA
jgi:hypothetical protein